MAKSSARKVAFVSSYPPRKCGIATFTEDLITNVKAAAGDKFEPIVVAMSNNPGYNYTNPVKFEIRPNVKNDFVCAADYLNFSNVHLVSLQHEFGLFGGPAGAHIKLFLQKVNAPVITTMHTVLDEPDADYYKATIDLCNASHQVIVMNIHGITLLKEIYKIPESKIQLIPHGIPDLPFVDSSYYKHKFGMETRKTILTFGLLSRNKGIEVMLNALPDIVEADPSIVYLIVGQTHPEVIKHEGEAYRFKLQRMVKDLGITDNVVFYNRFVKDEELHDFLCAADIYITPYLHREQLTSGTLVYAVGTGKATVSSRYWAAEELLDDGRGRLVPFGDSKALSENVIELIKDDNLFHTTRRKAYDYGREITWPIIGQRYFKMFSAKDMPVRLTPKPRPTTEELGTILELPEPPLVHIRRLTDDTGMLQHAKFTIPNRAHGYCTDDNARAVVAITKYYAQYAEPTTLKLLDTYISFLMHAQKADGTVYNLMTYDRRWLKKEPRHDALGRLLWAFGSVIATPPWPDCLSIMKEHFDLSAKHIPTLSPRGMAYSLFGLNDYLTQFPGASEIKRLLALAADTLMKIFDSNAKDDWPWFEDILAYDNAILPCALYTASLALGEEKYIAPAERAAQFLLENTFNGRHFSFVGCNGWYRRGKKRALFDQQPIEVASTVMMLRAGYEATLNREYLKLQRKCFDWFLGENDLGVPVYDFHTKGCCDGLEPGGVNLNQGAESMLCFLQSLLCVAESYTAFAGSHPSALPKVKQAKIKPLRTDSDNEDTKAAPRAKSG